jgi:hypothetical protein
VTNERFIFVCSDQGETYLKLVVTKERLILVGSDHGKTYRIW